MNWTNYRWQEGIAVIGNHQDYQESLAYCAECISHRLSIFCIKTHWKKANEKH